MNAGMLAFLPGSPGALELLVIFVVVLLLFGPRKLPEVARMIGRALHELRRASDDFRNEIMSISTETPHHPADASASPQASASAPMIDGEIIQEEEAREPPVEATESPAAKDDLAG